MTQILNADMQDLPLDAAQREALEGVPHCITDPERIPCKRYYDEAFFEWEREHLWSRTWQMACRLEEIPAPGDYTVYDILDRSVIVINTAGGIRAFHNACRHRGVKLASGPSRLGPEGFVCPFHGWQFDASGECTFVYGRNIFSEDVLAPAEINLAPVRVELWAGCAFINFDDDAPALRECLGPVAQRMDARHADKLRMEWWCGTVLPTNWKLAMEAFQEGYHVMQTHPQLFDLTHRASLPYGPRADGLPVNEDLEPAEVVNLGIDFLSRLGAGMDGMVHSSELEVIEKLRNMEPPADADLAQQMLYGSAYAAVAEDALARGVPMFDILKAVQEHPFSPVEFMFPHFFLLPMVGAMSSYRIRPLTAETCLFEIWSLVIPPEGEQRETPEEPTMIPYDSDQFPEIPRQDYANLPIQQLGLHNMEFMRIARDGEGMISNYQRLIDGYLAGLDGNTLAKGSQVVNSGFNATILDIGF